MKRLLLMLLIFSWTGPAQTTLPFFPGETFQQAGMQSFGGTGRHNPTPDGVWVAVTNLNDAGAGSLRDAVDTDGTTPTWVLFFVSGYLDLDSNIIIDDPYITVDFESAPGDGIALRDHLIEIKDHNVVIKGGRFIGGDRRLGDDRPNDRRLLDVVSDQVTTYNVLYAYNTFAAQMDNGVNNSETNNPLYNVMGYRNLHVRPLMWSRNEDVNTHGMSKNVRVATTYAGAADSVGDYQSAFLFVHDRSPRYESVNGFIVNCVIGYSDLKLVSLVQNNNATYLHKMSIIKNVFEKWGAMPSQRRPVEVQLRIPGSTVWMNGNIWTDWPDSMHYDVGVLDPSDYLAGAANWYPSGLTILDSSIVQDFVLRHAGARSARRLPFEQEAIRAYIDSSDAFCDCISPDTLWAYRINVTAVDGDTVFVDSTRIHTQSQNGDISVNDDRYNLAGQPHTIWMITGLAAGVKTPVDDYVVKVSEPTRAKIVVTGGIAGVTPGDSLMLGYSCLRNLGGWPVIRSETRVLTPPPNGTGAGQWAEVLNMPGTIFHNRIRGEKWAHEMALQTRAK